MRQESPQRRSVSESAASLSGRSWAWLADSGLRDGSGRVLSWLNPAHPGYVYPEIMGYYASLCAERARHAGGERWLEFGVQVGAAIVGELTPRGALSRAGIEYAFDTAIGLHGLLRVQQVERSARFADAAQRMTDFLVAGLAEREVSWRDGRPVRDLDSWSHSFGASAIKIPMALETAGAALGRRDALELAARVREQGVAAAWRDGAFRINGERRWVYMHAHCYATEGLIFASRAASALPIEVRESAEFLARVQSADGGLPCWHERPDVEVVSHADATSQAVRIWSVVSRERHAASIERALAFLRSIEAAGGGLRYKRGSDDLNSWATIFGAQADQWQRDGAEPEWLL